MTTFADLENQKRHAIAQHSRSLFVVYDLVAATFIGQIIIDRHPAPVCRMFHQLLGDKQTQLSHHPKDFNLVHVGFVEDDGRVWQIDPTVVATGAAWLASQTPTDQENG